VGPGCQVRRLPLARAWCMRHGRDWLRCAGRGTWGDGGWPENPDTMAQCRHWLHRRLLNGEDRTWEREKEVRPVILPRVKLSRGGAPSGGGGPRSGTVERPRS
jgi:hypothetical protein